jgi:hypothetical protein
VDGTVATLRRWLELDPTLADTMRVQATESFKRRFTVDAMSKDLLRVLQAGSRENDAAKKRPVVSVRQGA